MATATVPTTAETRPAQQPRRTWAERREARHRRRLQMLAWRVQGYQLKEIGAAFGVSDAFVCQELRYLQPKVIRPALPPLPNMRKSA